MTVALVLLVPAAEKAAAQETRLATGACTADEVRVGTLGISGLTCRECTLHRASDPRESWWEYGAEPVVDGVRRGGPAEGALRPGDAIVAVDGDLVTTAEGGRLFSQPTPGHTVTLTVRRDGRTRDVRITAGAECRERPEEGKGPAAAPGPEPGEPVGIEARDRSDPRGWLGFGLVCHACSIRTGAAPVYEFREAPELLGVEAGTPAAAAGLRAGDRLTHIDGVPLTSPDGGRRFGWIAPGDTVHLRVERGGRPFDVAVVAADRPDRKAVGPERYKGHDGGPEPVHGPLRFSGSLGPVFVEVSGGPVTVTRSEGELLIEGVDLRVRLRSDGEPQAPDAQP